MWMMAWLARLTHLDSIFGLEWPDFLNHIF